MNQDNLTDAPLADEAHVTSADGGAAVDSSTLTLAELNQYLGKDFKDTKTALQALKDTQSFVGKRKEDIAKEVQATVPAQAAPSSNLESEVRSLKAEVFFTQNPQYKEYASLISKLGADPAEVVNMPEFQAVYEKGKVADEVQQTRSVVASNGRVAQSSNTVNEAVKIANATRSTERTADALARGIIEELAL